MSHTKALNYFLLLWKCFGSPWWGGVKMGLLKWQSWQEQALGSLKVSMANEKR